MEILFNPDIIKRVQEIIGFWKNAKIDCQAVYFNEAPVAHTLCQNHLGIHLYERLILIIMLRRKQK